MLLNTEHCSLVTTVQMPEFIHKIFEWDEKSICNVPFLSFDIDSNDFVKEICHPTLPQMLHYEHIMKTL